MAVDDLMLYFAYGLNMDEAGMAGRCPGARLLGTALLAGHRFAITRLGVATVLADRRASVPGLLWHLTPADERALDAFELVAAGQYRKAWCALPTPGGRFRRCRVYRAADSRPGRAGPGYLEAVWAARRRHGLPTPTSAGTGGRPRRGGLSPRRAWAPG
ncbi:MAG: gamma-glutamylcyclotransferase [Magnetospirillum sp. WYHS-4]